MQDETVLSQTQKRTDQSLLLESCDVLHRYLSRMVFLISNSIENANPEIDAALQMMQIVTEIAEDEYNSINEQGGFPVRQFRRNDQIYSE